MFKYVFSDAGLKALVDISGGRGLDPAEVANPWILS